MLPKVQKLEDKLKKHFGEDICIEKGNTRKGIIVFSASLSINDALLKQNDSLTNTKTQIRDVAFALRDAIKNLEKRPLSQNIKLEDLQKGEVDVHEIVDLFIKSVICGPDTVDCDTPAKRRRIKSISEDLVFAVTSGRMKPRKYVMLGIAMKSLTGSKKVLEMLNR